VCDHGMNVVSRVPRSCGVCGFAQCVCGCVLSPMTDHYVGVIVARRRGGAAGAHDDLQLDSIISHGEFLQRSDRHCLPQHLDSVRPRRWVHTPHTHPDGEFTHLTHEERPLTCCWPLLLCRWWVHRREEPGGVFTARDEDAEDCEW